MHLSKGRKGESENLCWTWLFSAALALPITEIAFLYYVSYQELLRKPLPTSYFEMDVSCPEEKEEEDFSSICIA